MFCIFHKHSYIEQSLTICCSQGSSTVHINYSVELWTAKAHGHWHNPQEHSKTANVRWRDVERTLQVWLKRNIIHMQGCKGPGRQGQRCINVDAIANPKFWGYDHTIIDCGMLSGRVQDGPRHHFICTNETVHNNMGPRFFHIQWHLNTQRPWFLNQ